VAAEKWILSGIPCGVAYRFLASGQHTYATEGALIFSPPRHAAFEGEKVADLYALQRDVLDTNATCLSRGCPSRRRRGVGRREARHAGQDVCPPEVQSRFLT
jgi:hypothetical protein